MLLLIARIQAEREKVFDTIIQFRLEVACL
jgi:hypothetical protein